MTSHLEGRYLDCVEQGNGLSIASEHDDLTLSLKYCSVHKRAWVEALGQWVAFPEPTMDGSPVMEAACDTCTVFVFQTFRAHFPALYACSL